MQRQDECFAEKAVLLQLAEQFARPIRDARGRFDAGGAFSAAEIGSIYFLCKGGGVAEPSKRTLTLLGEWLLPTMVPVLLVARRLRAIPSSFSLQREPIAKLKISSVINYIEGNVAYPTPRGTGPSIKVYYCSFHKGAGSFRPAGSALDLATAAALRAVAAPGPSLISISAS